MHTNTHTTNASPAEQAKAMRADMDTATALVASMTADCERLRAALESMVAECLAHNGRAENLGSCILSVADGRAALAETGKGVAK